ncbi:ARHGEF33 [Branchiostoma lanceolatum]|uniref:ARHGEF33 protein n=1 Tax=Branchiostoma lanceolatum TaxID=7740 RepID=A0A8J9ZX53_BRALA|nr:ARHGEF33 [Branchiostoma lanceolatum]
MSDSPPPSPDLDEIETKCDNLLARLSMDTQSPAQGEGAASQEDLALQINQLQSLVSDMKTGFEGAMQELGRIQIDDKQIEERLDNSKSEFRQQVLELSEMFHSLKGDFDFIRAQIQQTNDSQQALQQKVDSLLTDRDGIRDEIVRLKETSNNLNKKDHLQTPSKSSEHSHRHSNQPSDPDSGAEDEHDDTHPVSPLLHPYLASLAAPDDLDNAVDSDDSLTRAAQRSLRLSLSLRQQCLEAGSGASSEEDEESFFITSNKRMEVSKSLRATPKKNHRNNNSAEGLRGVITQDFVESESQYVSYLAALQEKVVEPLRQADLVSSREISAMFPAVLQRLHMNHSSLLRKMQGRKDNRAWQGVIGDICGQLTDQKNFLDLYVEYVKDFPDAMTTLNQNRRHSSRFRKFMKNCMSRMDKGAGDVASILLAPVQRIPQYVIFFQKLLKHTRADHPDHYYLESSLEKLQRFLDQYNISMETAARVAAGEEPSPSRSGSSYDVTFNSGSTTTRDSGVHSEDKGPRVPSPSTTRRFAKAASRQRRRAAKDREDEHRPRFPEDDRRQHKRSPYDEYDDEYDQRRYSRDEQFHNYRSSSPVPPPRTVRNLPPRPKPRHRRQYEHMLDPGVPKYDSDESYRDQYNTYYAPSEGSSQDYIPTHHRSMPWLIRDRDDIDEPLMDPPQYQPSLLTHAPSRTKKSSKAELNNTMPANMVAVNRPHSNQTRHAVSAFDVRDGRTMIRNAPDGVSEPSPSKQQLAMALAKSLTQENVQPVQPRQRHRQTPPSSGGTKRSTPNGDVSVRFSSGKKHTHKSGNQEPVPQKLTGVWSEEQPTVEKIPIPKERKEKKRKPDTPEEAAPPSVSPKKKGLKKSLKNIFFKKKGQKVQELDGHDDTMATQLTSLSDDIVTTRQSRTPPSVTPGMTFHDENGDPCSAV